MYSGSMYNDGVRSGYLLYESMRRCTAVETNSTFHTHHSELQPRAISNHACWKQKIPSSPSFRWRNVLLDPHIQRQSTRHRKCTLMNASSITLRIQYYFQYTSYNQTQCSECKTRCLYSSHQSNGYLKDCKKTIPPMYGVLQNFLVSVWKIIFLCHTHDINSFTFSWYIIDPVETKGLSFSCRGYKAPWAGAYHDDIKNDPTQPNQYYQTFGDIQMKVCMPSSQAYKAML